MLDVVSRSSKQHAPPTLRTLALMAETGRRTLSTVRRDRTLARLHTVADARSLARRRVPPAVFDYIEGGAGEERTGDVIVPPCVAPPVGPTHHWKTLRRTQRVRQDVAGALPGG